MSAEHAPTGGEPANDNGSIKPGKLIAEVFTPLLAFIPIVGAVVAKTEGGEDGHDTDHAAPDHGAEAHGPTDHGHGGGAAAGKKHNDHVTPPTGGATHDTHAAPETTPKAANDNHATPAPAAAVHH
ncbi:hypothetical protein K2X83_01460 [Patescibacteria group bacterium]|nr:hypothetical protein [Patescibacteria group bacterium]